MMRQLVFQSLTLLCLALVPAIASGLWHPHRPAWQADVLAEGEVALNTVKRWPEPILWIDARGAESYDLGHVPGAQLLNEDEWEVLLEPVLLAWQPDMRVVVYCDSQACRSSHEVAERLRDEMQWEEVYTLHDGWAVLSEKVP